MIYRIYLKYIDIYVSFHPIRLNMLNFNRLVFQNREFENIITTTITEQQEHKKRVGETKNSKKKWKIKIELNNGSDAKKNQHKE